MTFYSDGHSGSGYSGGGAYALAGSNGGSGSSGNGYVLPGSGGSGKGSDSGSGKGNGSGSGSSQPDSYSVASALNVHSVMASDDGSGFDACGGAALIQESMQGNDYSSVTGVENVKFKEKKGCPAIVASKAAVAEDGDNTALLVGCSISVPAPFRPCSDQQTSPNSLDGDEMRPVQPQSSLRTCMWASR